MILVLNKTHSLLLLLLTTGLAMLSFAPPSGQLNTRSTGPSNIRSNVPSSFQPTSPFSTRAPSVGSTTTPSTASPTAPSAALSSLHAPSSFRAPFFFHAPFSLHAPFSPHTSFSSHTPPPPHAPSSFRAPFFFYAPFSLHTLYSPHTSFSSHIPFSPHTPFSFRTPFFFRAPFSPHAPFSLHTPSSIRPRPSRPMFYPSAAIVSRTTQLSDISSVSYPINPSDIFLVPRPTCPSITPVFRTPGPPITLVFHPRSLFVTAVSYRTGPFITPVFRTPGPSITPVSHPTSLFATAVSYRTGLSITPVFRTPDPSITLVFHPRSLFATAVSYRTSLSISPAHRTTGPSITPVSRPTSPSDTAIRRPKDLSDSALLDLTERQTFKYFWDFAHPVSGLSRERSNVAYNYGHEVCTIGGSGFGVMAIIVGTERKWITREQAVDRLLKEINFLAKADSYHGIFPHWLNGETGKTIPFSRKDDGADLVETSYLMEGLLCARQYFNGHDGKETELRNKINWLWQEAEFNWHTRGGLDLLYWHWSPNNGWSMNFELRGWNECLITYVLAASSPRYSISPEVYHHCWAESTHFYNGKSFYGITLPLGFDYGGPLFFAHYSFLGLDPRGLKDRYADYWEQNKNHTLINREHCVRNPGKFKGYGPDCWGLTASDNYEGYNAHSPTNDLGVITPSAALSSFPYTPQYSMQALRYFYDKLGDKIWGEYGFTDAFSEEKNWYAIEYLAIDQGPEIAMIENYRSGLLWKLFMSCPEIQAGLKKLGFTSPWIK